MKSRLFSALAACTLVLSGYAEAAVVNPGIVADHTTYVSDSLTGLDWLDLTATAGLSYNAVLSETASGGRFEGWRYATRAEVATLWTHFGGNPGYYLGWPENSSGSAYNPAWPSTATETKPGWSSENEGLFDIIAGLMGDLGCDDLGNADTNCTTGRGFTHWITGDVATQYDVDAANALGKTGAITLGQHVSALLFDYYGREEENIYHWDYATLSQVTLGDDIDAQAYSYVAEFGSALVRVSAVPLPGAFWLFLSGLIGLAGRARRTGL